MKEKMKKVGRKTMMKRKKGEERRVEGRRRHCKLDVFLGTHDNIYLYVRKLFTLNTGKEPPTRTRISFWHSDRAGNTASTDLEK